MGCQTNFCARALRRSLSRLSVVDLPANSAIKVAGAAFEIDLKSNLYKIWNRISPPDTFHRQCGWVRYRSMTSASAHPGFRKYRRLRRKDRVSMGVGTHRTV